MTFRGPVVWVALLAFPLLAAGQDQALIRQQLEEANVSFSTAGFIEQVRRGEAETVDLFLQAGMNPNVQDKSGRTALIWAAGNGHVAVVERLLDSGADLCGAGSRAQSALVWAASNGRTDAARVLLKAGARACEKEKRGMTSVTAAAMNGYADTLRMLLEKIDDVPYEEKVVAFASAAESGHLEVLRLLLDAGVDAEARTPSGSTPSAPRPFGAGGRR
ncbi:MAG: ankyrin repeat domain-containing protein [Candidatus Manganitrophus sp.]|nr:MAG: ankyrin repeat domain-containing protein [Candidatus Manganitrophus sp.]